MNTSRSIKIALYHTSLNGISYNSLLRFTGKIDYGTNRYRSHIIKHLAILISKTLASFIENILNIIRLVNLCVL
jgi:hypothetical protein